MEIPLSEFTIIKELGRGAFGVVHLAEWQEKQYAVKSVNTETAMRHEVNIMKRLSHPNVVTIIAYSFNEPDLYVAMEYLEGGNLSDLLSSKTPITLPMQQKFALDIARGVNYLHSLPKPVFHRDLKANNVLIDRAGTLKVSDFGLSTVNYVGASAATAKQPFNWYAPEFAQGAEYTAKCDVYSYAMTLFEILARKLPFQDKTAVQIFFALMQNQRPFVPFNAPYFLATLMIDCWHNDPIQRPTFENIVLRLEMVVQQLRSSIQQESNPTMEDLQQQIKDLQQQVKDLQLAKQALSSGSSQANEQAMMFSKALVDLEKGRVSAEALLNGDVVKQVISCLTNKSTSTSVLEAATELVAALFSHDAVKKAVSNQPRPIVNALFTCLRNNANVSVMQQHIFTAIGNLTDKQDASQNWLVSDYDAINIVVKVLKQSPSLADLQAQAYYALQKIANRNEANIRFLFNTHLAHQLALTSMTYHVTHIPVQTQGCALLRRLSFLPETLSVLMTTATATVIQSMTSFAAEPQIQEHGCAFIYNVARDAANQKLLVREPHLAHQVILSAMRNHPQSAVVQEEGCCALTNLAANDDNKKLLVREPYFAHQVILSAMRNHPLVAAVQEEGCSALSSLAVDADNQKLLVQNDAHTAFIAALTKHAQHEGVQLYAVWALSNLSFDVSNRGVLKQAGALPLCEKAQSNFPNNKDLAARLATVKKNLA